MNSLYLIVSMVVSLSCPSGFQIGSVNAGYNINHANIVVDTTHGCSCPAMQDVHFALSKERAELALEEGKQVWRIQWFYDGPFRGHLGAIQMARVSSTTYSIQSNPVEVAP